MNKAIAHRVDPRASEAISVLGPTLRFLLSPDDDSNAPCMMLTTVPSGIVIPLHAHPEPETLFAISGQIEALAETAAGFAWLRLSPGDMFHVPAGAKHAFRNHWGEPAIMLATITAQHGRFFQEVGRIPRRASGKRRQFAEIAARHGHWLASAEENFQVGIDLPTAA